MRSKAKASYEADMVSGYNINKYTVTFNSDGGSPVDSQSVDYNTTAKQPSNPTKTGYTFLGWYLNDQPYVWSTPVTSNITLVAKWQIINYTVTFNSNGGTAVNSQTVPHGSKATDPGSISKTGYTFNYWCSDSALNTRFDFNIPITSNITLYAKFTINSYTVTFNTDGGSSVASQTVNYGAKASRPANPTKTGYNFVNWYTDVSYSTVFNFDNPITSNITVYAKFQIITYTITFNSNGGSAVASQGVNHGSTVSRPHDPTKTDHWEFVNWYTDSGLQNVYNFSASVTSSFTLYAKWQGEPVTVRYNLNGGTINGQTEITVEARVHDTITIISDKPIKSGYTFTHWEDKLKNRYNPGDLYEITSDKLE